MLTDKQRASLDVPPGRYNLCSALGLSEDEYLALWAARYVRADGSVRAHIASVETALQAIRAGRLPQTYTSDRGR